MTPFDEDQCPSKHQYMLELLYHIDQLVNIVGLVLFFCSFIRFVYQLARQIFIRAPSARPVQALKLPIKLGSIQVILTYNSKRVVKVAVSVGPKKIVFSWDDGLLRLPTVKVSYAFLIKSSVKMKPLDEENGKHLAPTWLSS